jgi:hypothetical protein
VLIGEKIKGKPRYDQKDSNSWLSPYIIRKKSNKDMYHLIAFDRRKMLLLVDGSLLQPHI